MRNNQPNTQREIDYRDSAIIRSRSDPKGVVTEVNRDFSEISGYQPDEIVGKPHNVLRHPDMPESAYADLWRTIKSGRLWHGIVKNRAKNGDHYWVEANVAPILDARDQITGYVSVRTKPSRAQIDQTEAQLRSAVRGKQKPPRHPVAAHRLLLALITGLTVLTAMLGSVGWPWPVVGLVAAMAGGLVVWAIQRLVFAPLESLRRTMLDCQADGNLGRRAQVFRDDEIGQIAKTYNALMLTMRAITREVQSEATVVSAEIAKLAVLGIQVQGNSADQQEATMQAAASIEQLTVSASSVAATAREVKTAADASQQLINQGHHRIDDFQSDLDTISSSVSTIESAARQFDISTAEIEGMVKHVREIADQTNLLALNAAIEAARAGEHGRGFAVVADEVRKLASTSAQTAGQIQRVTSEILAGSEAVRNSVAITRQSVARGQSTMHDLSQVFASSETQFDQTRHGVTEISQATAEQACASTSLANNVERITRRGEENDHAMCSLAELADGANGRARSLVELAAMFK